MERPRVSIERPERRITGEIAYLDDLWRSSEYGDSYQDLSDMAIQMYETEADLYQANDVRPEIMDTYELYEREPTELEASCRALLNELHNLRDQESSMTFVDIVVESDASEVLTRLKSMAAGSVLHTLDEQLAFESGGYYPDIDMRMRDAVLSGVGIRVFKWDSDKYSFTDLPGENGRNKILRYPADERAQWGDIELTFSYDHPSGGQMSESASLHINTDGSLSYGSQVWVSAYAETGYEGHSGRVAKLSDQEIADFADLIAEIVGDEPISFKMYMERDIASIRELAVSDMGKTAVDRLIDATWPAQARYFLSKESEDGSIAALLTAESTVDQGVLAIDEIIEKWNNR